MCRIYVAPRLDISEGGACIEIPTLLAFAFETKWKGRFKRAEEIDRAAVEAWIVSMEARLAAVRREIAAKAYGA